MKGFANPTHQDMSTGLLLLKCVQRVNSGMSNTKYKHLSFEERVALADNLLITCYNLGLLADAFRQMFPENDRVTRHFHFVVTLDDFASAVERKDAAFMTQLLKTNGSIVSPFMHSELNKKASADGISRACGPRDPSAEGQHVFQYYSGEIFLTDRQDTKQITGMVREESYDPSSLTKEDFVRVMRKEQPDFDMTDHDFAVCKDPRVIKYIHDQLTPEQRWKATNDLAAGLRTCANCQKRNFRLKQCPCKTQVYYCGVECQRAHWAEHGKTCEKKKKTKSP